MSANRLFQIINILLIQKSVTAKELSQKLEVSVRTIYRDIDALSLAGVPIYTSQGKGGGISLLPSYILDKSLISESEQEYILGALKNISIDSNEVEDLLLKLRALFQKTDMEWIEVDLSRWGNKEYDKEKFNLLKDSIINKHILNFTYISSYGEKTQRSVKPIKLIFKSKSWYLQAFCIGKDSFRTFKINRMNNIGMSDEYFKEIYNPPSIDSTREIDEYPLLRLKFDKSVAYRVYDEFDPSKITLDDKGDFIISIRMPEDLWLYGFLLSFGSSLTILEPNHIRDYLVDEAEKIFKANKKSR